MIMEIAPQTAKRRSTTPKQHRQATVVGAFQVSVEWRHETPDRSIFVPGNIGARTMLIQYSEAVPVGAEGYEDEGQIRTGTRRLRRPVRCPSRLSGHYGTSHVAAKRDSSCAVSQFPRQQSQPENPRFLISLQKRLSISLFPLHPLTRVRRLRLETAEHPFL